MSSMSSVLQRDAATRKASQVPTSYILVVTFQLLGTDVHLALCVDCELCLLDASPGVVCACHGVQRKKVRRRNFLRWAPIYVAQSHWLTAISRNSKVHLWSYQQQRLLRILWSRNQMKWDGLFTSCDLSDAHIDSEFAQKLTERRSNKNRLRYNHRERGSNPSSICSFSGPSSVPGRGHWNCTKDYSIMRGSLNSAFGDCETID